jgi:hypothetical protein
MTSSHFSLALNAFSLKFPDMKGVLVVLLCVMISLSAGVRAAEVSGPLDSLSAANAEELRFSAVSLSDLQEYAPSDKTDWIDGQKLAVSPLPRPVIATRAPARKMALITSDPSKEMAEESFPVKSRYHVSGEIGAAYGTSIGNGKYGAESESGYIIGGVGNDKVQITAGASYENTTFHVPRYGH